MDPLRRPKNKRKGLTLEELRFLASHAPKAQQRVFLLGGTLGGRIMELLHAEDAWLDLDVPTLTIPAWACKERRDRAIYLLPEEVALIREQQLIRPANTARGRDGSLVLFPRPGGRAWGYHGGFYGRVVVPTRTKAAEAWRRTCKLPADAPTPFEWQLRDAHGELKLGDDGKPVITGFAPHDLRRGAATLMRELGLSPELSASRLGHKDSGYLLVTVYADAREERLRAELDAIADEGGIDARLARRKRRRK
jgi:integrase